jgi:hypothetical protein
VQRAWLWTVDEFYDRVFTMREQFALHLRSQPTHAKHIAGDPFWAPPKPEVLGKAFLYLTPLAHTAAFADWLPIVDSHGKVQGSLKVSAKCTRANFVDAVPPRADPATLKGESLHFALRIDGAKGLIGDATTSTFVRFTWSGEETPRTTDVCEGRTTTPQYNYRENFELKACDAQALNYLTTDAICFEVCGEPAEIPEGVVKPAQIEQPPEIFDFFVSIDLHEAMDETRGGSWIEAAWEKGMTRDGKPALFITQNRPRRIVVSVSQQQSSFMVARFAHVWLGNLRDEFHNVWDPVFIPLSIVSQSRNGDRFELICDWFSQFDALNKPDAKDKIFYFDVKVECIELERLVMEEPIVLTRRLNVKVCDAAQQASMTQQLAAGLATLVGGAKKGPAAQAQVRRIMSVREGTALVADTDRIRRLEEHMQHYMGVWDITGEAVDIAMASLKSSAVADTGKEIKRQLHVCARNCATVPAPPAPSASRAKRGSARRPIALARQLTAAPLPLCVTPAPLLSQEMDEGLRQLSSFMLDEQQRQLEVLHRELGKSDADVAAAIAKKKAIATSMAAAANVALQVRATARPLRMRVRMMARVAGCFVALTSVHPLPRSARVLPRARERRRRDSRPRTPTLGRRRRRSSCAKTRRRRRTRPPPDCKQRRTWPPPSSSSSRPSADRCKASSHRRASRSRARRRRQRRPSLLEPSRRRNHPCASCNSPPARGTTGG